MVTAPLDDARQFVNALRALNRGCEAIGSAHPLKIGFNSTSDLTRAIAAIEMCASLGDVDLASVQRISGGIRVLGIEIKRVWA